MQIDSIPKVILHEHIEGSVTPALAKILAKNNGIVLANHFLYQDDQYDHNQFPDGRYAYDESDFRAFIDTYDTVAGLIRTPHDYYLVVKDFLVRNAKQGLIYCEFIASPLHMSGENEDSNTMDPSRYHLVMDAIEQAIADVKQEFGVETRLHVVGIRHLGVEHINKVVEFIQDNPRTSISGFNIAGDERANQFLDFQNALNQVKTLGLGRSYHAGEICSAESVQEALDTGAMRIGHGVQSNYDTATIQRLIENSITLEVSMTSNLILVNQYSAHPEQHPVRQLYDKGVRITLNTDDAGIFGTTINKEYQLAATQYGFNRAELLDVTLCALEAAFLDDSTKQTLIGRVLHCFTAEDETTLAHSIKQAKSGALAERLRFRQQQLAQINQ